jgi:hypothetical protein
MAGWRDFLDRFRPAGAPGAASPGGVPVDRAAAAAAELIPVLERLDAAQDEADRRRAAAQDEAARVTHAGTRAAAALLQQARDNAETVAAQAASTAMRAASRDGPDEDPETPAQVLRSAAQRQPADVERVVAAARDLIAGLTAPRDDAGLPR